ASGSPRAALRSTRPCSRSPRLRPSLWPDRAAFLSPYHGETGRGGAVVRPARNGTAYWPRRSVARIAGPTHTVNASGDRALRVRARVPATRAIVTGDTEARSSRVVWRAIRGLTACVPLRTTACSALRPRPGLATGERHCLSGFHRRGKRAAHGPGTRTP